MRKTHHPNTSYLFFFFLTLALAATKTSVSNSMNYCKTGSLSYPFGYSTDSPIKVNCSNKTNHGQIGEFTIQEVTSTNIFLNIPPLCKRKIDKIKQLFSHNYAPSNIQNLLLVQECNNKSSSSSSCVIRRRNCTSPVTCFEPTVKADVLSVEDVVVRSGCKYWFSSITTGSKPDSEPDGSFNLGRLKLDWWIQGGCSKTNCSNNALCKDVKLADGGVGHRCTCFQGFHGDAFAVPGGCRLVRKRNEVGRLIVLGTAGVLIGVSLMIILICTYIYRRKHSASSYLRTSIANRLLCELAGNSSVPFYSYKEIEKATDSFSDRNKLGTGAYGTVYAGEFPNNLWVAIKRLRRKDTTSVDQVVNEIKLLSSVSHPNLVRLLGCCISQGEPFLVYEFMPNGTLSQHLQFERGDAPLSWPTRLSIASQTADAIAHLHSSVNPPIYHRDIKSSNILLDYEFNSKLSDFGLSRLGMSSDLDSSHISTAPQGTPGYLDPQYHQDFQLSDKSDVYSFGVVLIEIISGFKVIDFTRPCTEVNLAALALDRIRRGRVADIIDPFLETENDSKMFASIQALAELAFRCLSFHRNSRPTITEVTEDLHRITLMYSGAESGKFGNRSDISLKRMDSQESSRRV